MASERNERMESKAGAEPRSGVVRIELDVLDDVVRAMKRAPRDAYWARRLLDLVRDPATATRMKSQLVDAIQCWADHDPSFFIHERYLSEQLAVWAWPREVLEELEQRLRLADPSLTHFVMGRLWLEARRPPEDMPEFFGRALRHLREVEPNLRVGTWYEAMCEALGVADPDELARSADVILVTAPPSARDRALLAILRGAARAANWELYDAHRRSYGALEPDGVPRMNSEIVRLDGIRAEQSLRHRPAPSFARVARLKTHKVETIDLEAVTIRPPSRPHDGD